MSQQFKSNRFYCQLHRCHILLALESAFAVLLSYYGAYWFSSLTHFAMQEIAGLWGAISSAIVITAMRTSSLKAGWFRFVGSVIGILVPMILIYILGYSVLAFGLSVFMTVIVCYLLPWHEAYHGALITVSVVFVVGKLLASTTPIWFNAISRLVESIIGIVVTLLIVFCFDLLRKLLRLPEESADR